MLLFRHSVCFAFSFKQFSYKEFRIGNIYLRIDETTAKEFNKISSSILLQT